MERLKMLVLDNVVILDLSAGEQTSLGKIVSHMYYGKNHELLDLLSTHWGYPHNGGQHSLMARGPKEEIRLFLEFLVDAYQGYDRVQVGHAELKDLLQQLQ